MRFTQKITTLLLLISFTESNSYAQMDTAELIFIVETMPLFENEEPANSFRRYIQNHIDEIEETIPDSISGRIILQFSVDTTGYVVDPLIIRGINEELDSIACQIVLCSPKWIPGKQRGQPVRVRFTFPVNINMDSNINNQYKIDNKKRKRSSKRKTTPNTR